VLGRTPLRGMPLLAAAVTVVVLGRGSAFPAAAAPAAIAAGYVAALAVLWQNRGHRWMLFIFAGLALNGLVIVLNGGRMPLSIDALTRVAQLAASPLLSGGDAYHVFVGPGTRLRARGDVLPVGFAGRGAVLSPGDVLLGIGYAIVTLAVLTAVRRGHPLPTPWRRDRRWPPPGRCRAAIPC